MRALGPSRRVDGGMTFVSRASSSAPSSRCSRTDDGAPMASRRDSRTPHQTAAAPSPGPPPKRRARRPRGARAPGSPGARRGRTRRCSRSAVLPFPRVGRRLRSSPETRAPRGAREILARGRRGAAQRVRGAAFFVIFLLRCASVAHAARRLACVLRSVRRLLIACCAALLLDCTLARREVPQRWSQ